MTIVVCVRAAGLLLLALAGLHFALPRRLGWPEDLARLTLLNRQIFLVHTFFIVLVLAMMGLLSLCFPEALLAPSTLSRLVLGGLTLFWVARLVVQWFGYDRSLWRGNRFNTAVHYVFTAVWSFFAATYGAALWQQLHR